MEAMKEITIHYIDTEEVKLHEQEIAAYIDEERREKASRYLFEKDKLLSLGASYLISRFTSNNPILYTESGKPYKEGEYFSISHSGSYAIFASASSPIGVDIELIRPYSPLLKEAVLNEEERKRAKNDGDFFRLWCLKESLLKATGEGLSKRLKEVNPLEGTYIYKDRSFASKTQKLNEHMLSVTIESDEEITLLLSKTNFEIK